MIHQTDTESPQPVAEAENLVGVASTALFCVGDSVTWTHATSNGKSIGFSTRQGKIETIMKTQAHVKLRNNRREWVLLKRLRKEGQRTELTEMIMGEDSSQNAQDQTREPKTKI